MLKMSGMKSNLLANVAGKAWSLVAIVLFTPLYLKFLGIEAFAIIGLYNSFCMLLIIVDPGLSSTLARELAWLSPLPGRRSEMATLVRTLETSFFLITILVTLPFLFLSDVVARHWINLRNLSVESAVTALRLLAGAACLQFVAGFYTGGLRGLQRHVHLNGLLICTGLLRSAGSVAVLWLVSPTIEAFMAWQVLVNAAQLIAIRHLVWRLLRDGAGEAQFQFGVLKSVWRYAGGMTVIGATGALFLQLDKIILSKLLTLDALGAYTVGGIVGSIPLAAAAPIGVTVLPRLTELVSLNDAARAHRVYHGASQLVSIVVFPLVIVVGLYAREILAIWTRDPASAEQAYRIASLLILSSGVVACMFMPYSLQMAYGWTGLSISLNIFGIAALTPLMLWLVPRWGGAGAALAFLLVTVAQFVAGVQIMHKRFLVDQKWSYWGRDIGAPLAAALVLAGIGWFVIPVPHGQWTLVAYLLATWMLASFAALLCADELRPLALAWLRSRAGRSWAVPNAFGAKSGRGAR